ncbi:MAG: hypothetical protein V9H26_28840 [Verrucomicrobiota bacterium]
MTLWNVKLPYGFLARLPNLWWLDIRGGTGENLLSLRGASHLKYLAINQVRGLAEVSPLSTFSNLRFLSLYGLPQVSDLPSLSDLADLARVEVGQMKALSSLTPLLDAPHLKELFLIRKLNVTSLDVARITTHPTLERFDWFAEDVPDRVWKPIIDAIKLPQARAMHPEEWFGLETSNT